MTKRTIQTRASAAALHRARRALKVRPNIVPDPNTPEGARRIALDDLLRRAVYALRENIEARIVRMTEKKVDPDLLHNCCTALWDEYNRLLCMDLNRRMLIAYGMPEDMSLDEYKGRLRYWLRMRFPWAAAALAKAEAKAKPGAEAEAA